jgi:hypothetical protein
MAVNNRGYTQAALRTCSLSPASQRTRSERSSSSLFLTQVPLKTPHRRHSMLALLPMYRSLPAPGKGLCYTCYCGGKSGVTGPVRQESCAVHPCMGWRTRQICQWFVAAACTPAENGYQRADQLHGTALGIGMSASASLKHVVTLLWLNLPVPHLCGGQAAPWPLWFQTKLPSLGAQHQPA